MALTSDHHAARLVFQSASVLIAEYELVSSWRPVRLAVRRSSGSGRSPVVPVIRHHRLGVGAGLPVVGWGGWLSWTLVFICR